MNWSAPAELYSSVASFKARSSRYMRFPSAADAVRFAIEEMPRSALGGVAIECGEDRYEGETIRALYDAPEYPLKRETR